MGKAYFFDGGRSQFKISNLAGEMLTVPSGVVEITNASYNEIQQRKDRARPDVIGVHGRYFVVGEHAPFWGVLSNQNTAARYTWDNMGVAALSMILRYGVMNQSIDLVVSYPPLDFQYRDTLQSSLLAEWKVEVDGKEVYIDVNRVFFEDEPVAILRNLQFNEDGTYSKRTPIQGRALVFDGGGETADIAGTDSEGRLVESLLHSRHIGINHFISTFENAIRSKYSDFFMEVAEVDPKAIRQAFATGIFVGGGEKLDCVAESEQQKASYLNQVKRFIQDRSGGVRNFDVFVAGGGAPGLLQHDLYEALGHSYIVPAVNNFEHIHLAGVSGMRKQYKFWKAQSWL